MSFSRSNEHFLKREFYSPLRGLSGVDRDAKYAELVKPEARRRIRLFYETVKYDVPKKIAFYQELLEIFGTLEHSLLLYSIYLDPHSVAISLQLGPSVIKYLSLDDSSLRGYFEQRLPLHDNSFNKGYLKDYFTKKLILSPGEWEEEDGRHNPVTNKLIAWLIESITQESKIKEIEDFLLNYTKLWNIYFTRTYNINKALILVHKFYEQYRSIDPLKLKINLNVVLAQLNCFIGELLPDIFNSPLTDVRQPSEIFKDGSHRNQSSTRAYLNKILEFQKRLTIDDVFFQDLRKLVWSQLFLKASSSQQSASIAYLNEIRKRYKLNNAPRFKDVDEFIKISKDTEEDLDQRVIENIVTANYLFFYS